MAPRSSKRKQETEEKGTKLKRVPSTTSSTKRRVHQPLAPSTSQNAIVKTTTTKVSKGRKSKSVTAEELKRGTISEDEHPRLNVYVFGSGSMGELGLGPLAKQRNVKRPRLNTNLLPEEIGIIDVAAGGMHCAAIDVKGRVWTWGVNDQGVLGRDTTWTPPENEDTAMDSDDEDDEQLNPLESTPGLVEDFPEGVFITKVACGDSITVALTDDRKVYAWGTFRVSPSLSN